MTRTRRGTKAAPAAVVVDSHFWVEYFSHKKNKAVAEIERLLRRDVVRIAEPVRYELLTGARTTGERAYLAGVLRALPSLDTTETVWAETVSLAVEGKAHLNRVPLSDVLIAAHCCVHGCSLRTRDPHFDVFPRLARHAFPD